jgi:hypothetical protein
LSAIIDVTRSKMAKSQPPAPPVEEFLSKPPVAQEVHATPVAGFIERPSAVQSLFVPKPRSGDVMSRSRTDFFVRFVVDVDVLAAVIFLAQAVKELGLPVGLQEALAASTMSVASRYWIVDNSGSMSTPDGRVLVQKPSGLMKTVQATRWAELGTSLRWQGQAAAAFGAKIEFRLLNEPENCVGRVLIVGDGSLDTRSQLAQLERMIESSPTGRTPLCTALDEVRYELEAEAPTLRAAGRSAVIVVASDGEASDGDVAQALSLFQPLPCSVIVRLCTDKEDVIAYWNR